MKNPAIPIVPTGFETKPDHPLPQRTGLIVFCETNLRYEGGVKAWITLIPYLLGAIALVMICDSLANSLLSLGVLMGYLILFPKIWQRILNGTAPRKAKRGLG